MQRYLLFKWDDDGDRHQESGGWHTLAATSDNLQELMDSFAETHMFAHIVDLSGESPKIVAEYEYSMCSTVKGKSCCGWKWYWKVLD